MENNKLAITIILDTAPFPKEFSRILLSKTWVHFILGKSERAIIWYQNCRKIFHLLFSASFQFYDYLPSVAYLLSIQKEALHTKMLSFVITEFVSA